MKNLLILLLVAPLSVFAQGSVGTAATQLLSFAVALILVACIFIAVRGIMLWYWKVNTIVENLERQNRTLTSILRKLEEKENNNSTE